MLGQPRAFSLGREAGACCVLHILSAGARPIVLVCCLDDEALSTPIDSETVSLVASTSERNVAR